MGTCALKGNYLRIDDHPFYVRGGEIQYFRLSANVWEDRLKQARDGGLNTIASYMPWYFHEPVEGCMDIRGGISPEHNLRGFLELAAKLDLKVIARPGPFINSELRCGGIPEWLFRNHPETMSRNSTGQIAPGRPLPAEGEPLYRMYVRKWYHYINPVLAEYDIHRGGPIILFQPDNELSAAWSFGLLNSLYDPTILETCWPDWLARRYKHIDILSDRYGRSYRSFNDVSPPQAFPMSPGEKSLCIDWLDFKRWFFADWGVTMARWAMEDGIHVPFIFNEPVAGFYGHGDHSGFGSFLKAQGISGTAACHTYSPVLIDLEGASEIVMATAITRSSLWGGPALSVEINTNWNIPRLCRSEINWEPLMRLGLAGGLAGSVIYPYTAGKVSLRDVIDGPEYWDPSCIDIHGCPSGAYRHLQRFNRFVAAWEKEILASEPAAEVTLAYGPGQRYLDFLGAPSLRTDTPQQSAVPGGEAFSAEPMLDRSAGSPGHDWLDGYEAVSKQTVSAEAGLWKKTQEAALLLARLNVAFDMRDLVYPNKDPGDGWILQPCTGSLDRATITYLLRHLDQGGKIVFFPTIPIFDLEGHDDSRLVERLKIRLIDQIRPAGGQVMDYGTRLLDFGQGDQTGVNGWLFIHDFPAQHATLASHEGRPVISSGKQVIVAGLDMAFTNFSGLRLWQGIFQNAMGLRHEVAVSGNYHYARLRKGRETDILTVCNVTGRSGPCTVHLPAKNITFNLELAPHEARCLVLNADLAGYRMLYTTSELIPLNPERSCLELHGHCGTTGRIAFTTPIKGVLEGKEVIALEERGYYQISYHHQDEPLFFELK